MFGFGLSWGLSLIEGFQVWARLHFGRVLKGASLIEGFQVWAGLHFGRVLKGAMASMERTIGSDDL